MNLYVWTIKSGDRFIENDLKPLKILLFAVRVVVRKKSNIEIYLQPHHDTNHTKFEMAIDIDMVKPIFEATTLFHYVECLGQTI